MTPGSVRFSARHLGGATLMVILTLFIQGTGTGFQSPAGSDTSPFDARDLIGPDTALPVKKSLTGSQYISQNSANPNEGQMALAIQLSAYNFHESAIKVLRGILNRQPSLHECHYRLGYSLELAGKVDESLESYQRYLELVPEQPVTLYRIGELLNRKGEIEKSNQFLKRYLESVPDCPAGQRRVGQNLLALNKPEEAIVYLLRVLEQFPLDRGNLTALSQAQLRAGKREEAQRNQETLAQFRSGELTEVSISLSDPLILILKKLNKSPSHSLDRAKELEDQGFFASANVYLQFALEGLPQVAPVHDRIGRNQYRLGQLDEALQSYNAALKLEIGRAHV